MATTSSKQSAKKPHDDLFEKSTMSFGEHLEELRVCLFRGVVGVALGCVIGFFIANQVVRFFQSPLEDAMERYYVDRALTEFKEEYGVIPIEVRRMVLDEGLIPERFQIEPARLAEALRLTYPQFDSLRLSPYWVTAEDFLPGGPQILCQRLAAAKDDEGTAEHRVWQLLSPEQRRRIDDLSSRRGRPLTADETSRLVAVLNDMAAKPELHDAAELKSLSGPDADPTSSFTSRLAWIFGWQAASAGDTVAELRKELAERPSAETTRRLNKLLLARVFPDALHKARLNLLSIYSWRPVKIRFQVLNAQESFMIWMKAGLMSGLILASPYLFYQVWIFVAAGLYPHEKHYVYLYLPISFLLFLGGASLAFVFVFQPVLDFLFTFNKGMNAEFEPRIGEWMSFVLILPLGFGLSFQLPLVMLFLNRIGVVSLELYLAQWRIAILIICVISMVLTPADPISMILMAVPLCLLYVLGIAFCKFMPKGRNPFAEAYEV